MYPCFKHKFWTKFYTHVNSHHNQDLKHIKLSKRILLHLLPRENLPAPTTGNNSSQQFSRIPCKWRHSLYSMSGQHLLLSTTFCKLFNWDLINLHIIKCINLFKVCDLMSFDCHKPKKQPLQSRYKHQSPSKIFLIPLCHPPLHTRIFLCLASST